MLHIDRDDTFIYWYKLNNIGIPLGDFLTLKTQREDDEYKFVYMPPVKYSTDRLFYGHFVSKNDLNINIQKCILNNNLIYFRDLCTINMSISVEYLYSFSDDDFEYCLIWLLLLCKQVKNNINAILINPQTHIIILDFCDLIIRYIQDYIISIDRDIVDYTRYSKFYLPKGILFYSIKTFTINTINEFLNILYDEMLSIKANNYLCLLQTNSLILNNSLDDL